MNSYCTEEQLSNHVFDEQSAEPHLTSKDENNDLHSNGNTLIDQQSDANSLMTSETLAGHAQEIVDEMEVKRKNDDTIIAGM